MTVTAFRIKNFMGFEDSGWIELRPITLLFGRNSTGKSAIMRALLLLRQSLRSKAEYGPLLFVDEAGYDFGSFEDLIRDHDLSYPMSFAFRQVFRRPGAYRSSKSEQDIDAENIEAIFKEVRILDSEDKRESLIVETELVYKFDKREKRTKLCQFVLTDGTSKKLILSATAPTSRNSNYAGWQLRSDFFADELKHRPSKPSVWPQLLWAPHIGFLPNLVTPEDHTEFFADGEYNTSRASSDNSYESFKHYLSISFRHIRSFFLLFHLGPMRPEPQRFYYAAGRSLGINAGQGLSFIRSYLDAKTDDVQLERLDTLQEWLQSTFKIGYEVKPLDTKERLFELTIQETGNSHSSNIREVGFGLSQLLPILIQTVVSGRDTQLLIEQPELHLHPGAQAKLGNLFIQTAQRGVRFIIETHSEHLLLRLQKQIALSTADQLDEQEDRLLPNQLSVYFVHREKGISNITEIEIGSYGDILNTPEGFDDFFSDDLLETAERMRIRLQGKRAGKQ